MVELENLWGDDFKVEGDYEKVKKILSRIKSPKELGDMPVEKVVSSKSIPFADKLAVVEETVHKILGSYADDTICIYDREELHNYITAGIMNGIMSIDTETIGTRTDIDKPGTDPFTCKICGLCLYTPGQKNAYIPINHTDYKTGERLSNQLTEQDVYDEMKRLVDAEVFNVFQNGKFDYMVLYYTCGIKVPISWDTMIFSQLANENEPAGLKYQYRTKINPDQEKYDIDKLFDLNMMDKYSPELFSLYAATDAYITYKLYEYQRNMAYKYEEVNISDNNGEFIFEDIDLITTSNGEKYVTELVIGDKIKLIDGRLVTITSIKNNRSTYNINVL